MFSPLEQFENHYYFHSVFAGGCPPYLKFSHLEFFVTSLWATTLFNTGVIFVLLWLGLSRTQVLQSGGLQLVLENWWSILTGIVRQQVGHEQRFTPLFVWTFGWIAVNNLAGLIPFNATSTAHLAVTLFLALGFNLGFFYWGLYYHGFKFFGLFVPSGAPVYLLPLIVVIEVVSYCIRPISLALRLFANMMAGHTLVHILLGFAAGASIVGLVLASVGIFAVTILEFGIALLQAYVFVVLACIYVRDALEPGH